MPWVMLIVSGDATDASATTRSFCARVIVVAVTAVIMSGTSADVALFNEPAISINCPTLYPWVIQLRPSVRVIVAGLLPVGAEK